MSALSNPIGEKVELITYNPGYKDTADLEAATKTVTATAEASGVGNADYTKALTFTIPTDARLAIKMMTARLAVTIDSMTATHLYCKVYIDSQDAGHLLFNEDFTSTGAKLDSAEMASGVKFDALVSGVEHTLYFFFWVDAGNAVISLVQAWEGVGTKQTYNTKALELTYTGTVSQNAYFTKVGTGTPVLRTDLSGSNTINLGTSSAALNTFNVYGAVALYILGTVAHDLNYIGNVYYVLRG